MLTEDSFFQILRFLGQLPYGTHHRFRMGDKAALREYRYWSLQTPIFKEFLENAPQGLSDFKRPRSCSATWAHQNPAFDSRLAKYLSPTVEDNRFQPLQVYSQMRCLLDEVVYGKEPKAIPEKAVLLEHLMESRCFTRHGRTHGRAEAARKR